MKHAGGYRSDFVETMPVDPLEPNFGVGLELDEIAEPRAVESVRLLGWVCVTAIAAVICWLSILLFARAWPWR